MDTDGDIALYKSLEMGIEPDLSEEERLEFCNDLRKSIRDAIDDFTYEEMADELGFTLQQVKNAMHRAKRDLIELIELQAYDDVLYK